MPIAIANCTTPVLESLWLYLNGADASCPCVDASNLPIQLIYDSTASGWTATVTSVLNCPDDATQTYLLSSIDANTLALDVTCNPVPNVSVCTARTLFGVGRQATYTCPGVGGTGFLAAGPVQVPACCCNDDVARFVGCQITDTNPGLSPPAALAEPDVGLPILPLIPTTALPAPPASIATPSYVRTRGCPNPIDAALSATVTGLDSGCECAAFVPGNLLLYDHTLGHWSNIWPAPASAAGSPCPKANYRLDMKCLGHDLFQVDFLAYPQGAPFCAASSYFGKGQPGTYCCADGAGNFTLAGPLNLPACACQGGVARQGSVVITSAGSVVPAPASPPGPLGTISSFETVICCPKPISSTLYLMMTNPNNSGVNSFNFGQKCQCFQAPDNLPLVWTQAAGGNAFWYAKTGQFSGTTCNATQQEFFFQCKLDDQARQVFVLTVKCTAKGALGTSTSTCTFYLAGAGGVGGGNVYVCPNPPAVDFGASGTMNICGFCCDLRNLAPCPKGPPSILAAVEISDTKMKEPV
jgi:hypothetical protein